MFFKGVFVHWWMLVMVLMVDPTDIYGKVRPLLPVSWTWLPQAWVIPNSVGLPVMGVVVLLSCYMEYRKLWLLTGKRVREYTKLVREHVAFGRSRVGKRSVVHAGIAEIWIRSLNRLLDGVIDRDGITEAVVYVQIRGKRNNASLIGRESAEVDACIEKVCDSLERWVIHLAEEDVRSSFGVGGRKVFDLEEAQKEAVYSELRIWAQSAIYVAGNRVESAESWWVDRKKRIGGMLNIELSREFQALEHAGDARRTLTTAHDWLEELAERLDRGCLSREVLENA